MERLKSFFVGLYELVVFVVGLAIPMRFRPHKSVKEETVLITGAGSGLGQLLAVRFAGLGARHLVLWDVNREGLCETEKMINENLKIGQRVHLYVCDVSDREEVRRTAASVKKEVGVVTILVNNCGIVVGKKFAELTEDEIERVMKVNTMSQFWTCKAFLPDMMARNHGHLVHMASAAGLVSVHNLSDYCASKSAIISFVESLRMELRSGGFDGVKTTIVCPYFTSTGMFQGLGWTMGVPVQSPEHVVDQTIRAVLTNQLLLVIPWTLNLFTFFKSFLPAAAFLQLSELLKTADMMKNFRGARDVFPERESEKSNQNGQT